MATVGEFGGSVIVGGGVGGQRAADAVRQQVASGG